MRSVSENMQKRRLEDILDDHHIRAVCLLSSTVFSAATCAYGWAAPVAALLGLATNSNLLKPDQDTRKALHEAVENALEDMIDQGVTDSEKAIIEELMQEIPEPQNLGSAIEETESYRTKCCTNQDGKRILQDFNTYFLEHVLESEKLKSYYIFSTNMVSLQQLKAIEQIAYDQSTKLDIITKGVDSTQKIAKASLSIAVQMLNELAFILAATAVCMILKIIVGTVDQSFCLFALMSYVLAAMVMWAIRRSRNSSIEMIRQNKGRIAGMESKTLSQISFWCIPVIVAVAIFILLSINYNRSVSLDDIAVMILGAVWSTLLRQTGDIVEISDFIDGYAAQNEVSQQSAVKVYNQKVFRAIVALTLITIIPFILNRVISYYGYK